MTLLMLLLVSQALARPPETGGTSPRPEIRLQYVSSMSGCRARLASLSRACAAIRRYKTFRFELGASDVDGDGRVDVVARSADPNDCGTRGCLTRVFLNKNGKFIPSDIRVVSTGPVMPCDKNRHPGLLLTSPDQQGTCFTP